MLGDAVVEDRGGGQDGGGVGDRLGGGRGQLSVVMVASS